MDRLATMPPPTTTTLLLLSTVLIRAHSHSTNTGMAYDLACVNDYLFTVNCSLSSLRQNAPDFSSGHWLVFTQPLGYLDYTKEERYVCPLSRTDGSHAHCSFDKSLKPSDEEHYIEAETFEDLDSFKITVCHNGADGLESCVLLEENYSPAKNITPKTPCNLTVVFNSSQYNFYWKNSYEEYRSLYEHLKYQLQFSRTGHTENRNFVFPDKTHFSADRPFVLDTEYTASVRSSPDGVIYRGHWSQWSPEVHWRTAPVIKSSSPNSLMNKTLTITFCVLVTLLLFICLVALFKAKKSTFIPTPVPYFSSLYTDHHGNFKKWVVAPSIDPVVQTEETLKIDKLVKMSSEEPDHTVQFHTGTGPHLSSSDAVPAIASSPGVPYAMIGPRSPVLERRNPVKSPSPSAKSPQAAENDSGCRLFVCREGTLCAFHEAGLVMEEHQGSGSLCSKMLPDRDYQNTWQQKTM